MTDDDHDDFISNLHQSIREIQISYLGTLANSASSYFSLHNHRIKTTINYK